MLFIFFVKSSLCCTVSITQILPHCPIPVCDVMEDPKWRPKQDYLSTTCVFMRKQAVFEMMDVFRSEFFLLKFYTLWKNQVIFMKSTQQDSYTVLESQDVTWIKSGGCALDKQMSTHTSVRDCNLQKKKSN